LFLLESCGGDAFRDWKPTVLHGNHKPSIDGNSRMGAVHFFNCRFVLHVLFFSRVFIETEKEK
jgi:hypothetical protein